MDNLRFLKQGSTFAQNTDQLHCGSLLICECGWEGPLREASDVNHKTRSGAIYVCHTVCKNCGLVLVTQEFDPPISLIEQANSDFLSIAKRKEK